jgi:CRISPR/Cas system-associated exonuclease Cas4 (RecB family)
LTEETKKPEREGLVFPYPEGDDFFDPGIPKGVISPSGFTMYRKCPRQFQYAYVLEMKKPPAVAMLKGTAIHKGAEVVHKHTIEHGSLLGMDAAVQAVDDRWEKEVGDIEDWDDGDGNILAAGVIKDITISNFRAYYVQAVPLIKPVAAEKPFAMKIGTVPIRGVIDLIDSIPGEYSLEDDPEQPPPSIEVVADLKTTKMRWAQQKLDHDVQMTIYSYVENTPQIRVDLLLDAKKGATYCPMRTTRSRQEKKVMVEDLEETVDLIKKGVFPRCDPTSWACTPKFCGYYEMCRGKKG